MDEEVELNRAWWDERAALHGADAFFYDIEGFLAGDVQVSERELSELESCGPLGGVDLLHVQCHIGLATLSLARLGARVTGLDFSPVAIARARALADEAGLRANFIEADVHHIPPDLEGQFDVVFASYGVLVWAHNVDAWMKSVASALRPAGRLILLDGHPLLTMVETALPPVLRWEYQGGRAVRTSYSGDYGSPEAVTTSNDVVMHLYGLGEVVTAATRAGLMVEALTEWTETAYGQEGGKLTRGEDGLLRMSFAGANLPVEYCLRAVTHRLGLESH